MIENERSVLLLVLGERLRGDDAAAPLAAQALAPAVRALAEVREVGMLEVDALLDVPAGVALVVADAAIGIPAGEIVTRALVDVARSAGRGGAPASSHALPPDQVLALAAELRGSLPRGVFVGIGGRQFGFGEQLSPEVEAAMAAFVESLAGAIRELAGDRDSTAG